MRRLVSIALALVATAGGAWFALTTVPVETWLFRHIAFNAVTKPRPVLAEKNELSVLFCGTGSPLPDKSRGGPCTLIAAGDKLYLVDAGIDSARNLLLWRLPLEKIAGVFVTHFHSDHIGELGEIRLQTWVAGRDVPLPVYGPQGIDQVVGGFNQAYSLDAGYRTAHHGAAMLPPDAVAMVARAIAPGTVLDLDGLKVTAIKVRHDPATPAYGYRFDYKGRSIVVSGDTAPDDNLARAAKGADILVHEGLSPEMVGIMHDALEAGGHARQAKIFHDIPGYHTSPVDAAKIANKAKARLLVFTHIIPMLPNSFAEDLFLHGVSDVRSCCTMLAHDGLVLRLREGSDDIDGKEDLD
ncbi:MAG TPA: MBL fold metallo-hydrolase [Rhizomicrobium sp.]|jgi:ribonuclease Z|nr:MBL fold metallo-hydrolase [Rhizomicrobium sp.]